MNKCPKCGTEFKGKFCPECGTAWQEEKTCPKCGAHLNGSVKFCNECGYSFLQQMPAPKSKGPKKTVTMENNLYVFLRLLPAILLALFAGLLFAFLAAPAVTEKVFGSSISGYDLLKLKDTDWDFQRKCYIALVVFTCVALIAAIAEFVIEFNKHRFGKLDIAHPVTSTKEAFALIAFYLIFFVIGCVVIGKVNAMDKGAGVFSADACPILILVFSLLFAAGSVISVIFGKRVPPTIVKTV